MKIKLSKAISLLLAFVMVFTVLSVSFVTVSADTVAGYSDYIKYRGQNLANTYAKLKAGKELNVVYYGGSVTNGSGASTPNETSWRALIGKWLVEKFPENTVNNINMAIGGTGSKMGAYRLEHDIIPLKPDLIFIEYAINDHYDDQVEDATMTDYSTRFETIIRNIRTKLPECDIVTILTTEKGYVTKNQAGELHNHAQEHEKICIAYDIPSIHVGRALADKVPIGDVEDGWKKYSGDIVHLNDTGYKVYFDVIAEYFNNCLFGGGYDGIVKNHTVPRMVNDYLLDGNMQVIDVDKDLVSKSISLGGTGFTYANDSDTARYWSTFGSDAAEPLDFSSAMSFVLQFTGTEIAILEHCGVKSSIESFKVKVDGGIEKTVGHYVDPTVLATGLEYGTHTITIKPTFKSDVSKILWIKAFFVRDERVQSAKYDHKHRFDNYVSDKNATCIKDGTKTARCYREGCDMTDTIVEEGSKLKHNFEVVATKKATFTKNGKGEKVCTLCDRFEDFVTIKKIKSVVASDCHYNGRTQTPKITVKDSAGKTVSSKYYTVKCYGKRKIVGTYKVKVTFKGNYKGSKTVKFKINPPKSSVKKLTASKKSLKVNIAKQTKQVKGYEIEYSTSKKFTKSTTKTQIVKSNKKTSLTLKGLKAKKKYYVRVRTYKSVGKTKYYSAWSKEVFKKTK